MSKYIQVPFKELPKDATLKQRHLALFEWSEETARLNPHVCLPLGVRKQWYHFFMREHPYTTMYKWFIPEQYKKR